MKGLILVYAITAVALLGSFRVPLLGLYAYCGFAVLRPQFVFGFAGDMSGVSFWLGLAVLAGWALNGFGSWRFKRARPTVFTLVLFMLWFLISATQALEPTVAFQSFNNLLKFMLPVFIGFTLLNTEKDRTRMLWVLVGAQGYVGFEMNLNYLVKNFNEASQGFGGMDNNCFGAALACMLGPAVALIISSKSYFAKGIAALCAALILHTALLTFSRGTMVGLLAVGVAAFLMMPKRPKHMAAVFLTLALAIRLTGPELAARYSTVFAGGEERDASAESRIDLWQDCLEVVAQYPVFGVGPANWRVISQTYGWSEGKSAHSVWMESAAELGIPGSLLLLFFFLVPVPRLWRFARERITDENRNDVAIAAGTVLSIVGFVVTAQFVSVSGLETPYYVVMVGAALLKGRPALVRPVQAPVAMFTPSFPPEGPVQVRLPTPAQTPRSLPGSASPILDLGGRRRSPSNG